LVDLQQEIPFLDRIDGPALVRLAWNIIFSLEHFGKGNHKLSSYKSGLGQGCSGYKENKKILPARHRSRSGEAGGLIVIILSKKVSPQAAKFTLSRKSHTEGLGLIEKIMYYL